MIIATVITVKDAYVSDVIIFLTFSSQISQINTIIKILFCTECLLILFTDRAIVFKENHTPKPISCLVSKGPTI